VRPVFGALLALVVRRERGHAFSGPGLRPAGTGEIYFVDGARSMVERGDYLFPLYRGEPFFDKPALTYWLIGGSFRLLGYGLAAARFVPALAGIGVVLATVWLGTLLLDRRSALAGGLALAATVGFMTFGRVAMSDMLLVLWTTLAFGLTLRGWQPARPPWVVPAIGAVLGLGFLTKGPWPCFYPVSGCWRSPGAAAGRA
jgi:4-amino-4-deoxy-L-arabinose transferase-like glycosyltransferase